MPPTRRHQLECTSAAKQLDDRVEPKARAQTQQTQISICQHDAFSSRAREQTFRFSKDLFLTMLNLNFPSSVPVDTFGTLDDKKLLTNHVDNGRLLSRRRRLGKRGQLRDCIVLRNSRMIINFNTQSVQQRL